MDPDFIVIFLHYGAWTLWARRNITKRRKPRCPPNLNNGTIFVTIFVDSFVMSREKVTSLFTVMGREKVMGLYENNMQLDTIC